MAVIFGWDPRKEGSNLRKHGVDFAEASTVFDDPLAKIFYDRDHSEAEPREIIIGYSLAVRLLIVWFTERKPGRIRLIGARQTTKLEKLDYEEAI